MGTDLQYWAASWSPQLSKHSLTRVREEQSSTEAMGRRGCLLEARGCSHLTIKVFGQMVHRYISVE